VRISFPPRLFIVDLQQTGCRVFGAAKRPDVGLDEVHHKGSAGGKPPARTLPVSMSTASLDRSSVAVDGDNPARHPPIIDLALPWESGKNDMSRSISACVSQTNSPLCIPRQWRLNAFSLRHDPQEI
jgi:hypothetical protein